MNSLVDSLMKPKRGTDQLCQVVEEELYWFIDPKSITSIPEEPKCYYTVIAATQALQKLPLPDPNDQEKWALTPTLFKFLANTPNRLAYPYPYGTFKQMLTEICYERLQYAAEVSGYMQPPIALDEFLCLYFLKKHQLRRLAELKMKEFLSVSC